MNMLLGPGGESEFFNQVSFLAAFMSTIDTHLNWGASYIINDIYKRFFKPNESEKHYVVVSKIITVVLMILAAFTALKMQSISKAWAFIFSMGAGIGLVLILRWFWWRINAWSEIAALSTSIVITLLIGMSSMVAGISKKRALTPFLVLNPFYLWYTNTSTSQINNYCSYCNIILVNSYVYYKVLSLLNTFESFMKKSSATGGWWGPITTNFEPLFTTCK